MMLRKSYIRTLFRKLLNFVPDQIVYLVELEVVNKRVRYQKSLLQCHGLNFQLAGNAVITSPELVSFGNDCVINDFVHIRGSGGVSFGNGVWVAVTSSITSETHPSDVEFIGNHPPLRSEVVIEDYVWIGSGAIILPGVTLGKSCIVGAGSVVTKDVPPYSIAVGVPARVVRFKPHNSVDTASLK